MHHGVSCFYSVWTTIYKVILDLSGVSATMPLKCNWCDCRVKAQKMVFAMGGERVGAGASASVWEYIREPA